MNNIFPSGRQYRDRQVARLINYFLADGDGARPEPERKRRKPSKRCPLSLMQSENATFARGPKPKADVATCATQDITKWCVKR